MTLQKYFEKNKEIQRNLLQFIDKEKDEQEDNNQFIKYFEDSAFCQDRHEFKTLLYLILKISNNYRRTPLFFQRIEQILLLIKDKIKQTFSNEEIFNIFKSNKRILLFLFKEQILIPDSSIAKTFSNPRYRFAEWKFQNFLLPEIESILDKKMAKKIKGQICHMLNVQVKNLTESDQFEEKRKAGENDTKICELIRKDSIEGFIILVNKENIALKTKIKTSIYETNPFLLKNEPTLIEYAAFFGAIQIFQYLRLNGIQPKPSIWLFAIHGRNPEIIHLLEENKISPPSSDYKECLNESLKCHHFEITDYIVNNFLEFNSKEDEDKAFELSPKYVNFNYFPKKLTNPRSFYYLCKYDYVEIVRFLMSDEDVDVQFKNIINESF